MSTTSTPTHPKPVETGSIQGAEYKEIPLDNLTPSKLNPRRRFDPKAMEELTLSVKAKGILQPLLVRKNGTGKGRDSGAAGAGGCESYEIVAGQRRARAAKAAGLAAVPCVIRALTDQEALESMVIENLQRADVHPLEEAAGYKQLMAMAGQGAGKMDVGAIAAKVGRSVAYIYDRVKLCALIPEAQKIFLADKITAGHAILLARLAPEDQKRCIDPDRASEGYGRLGGLWTGEYRLSLDDEEGKEAKPDKYDELKPVSVRELAAWIDEHVRFDKTDVDPMLFPDTAAVLERTPGDVKAGRTPAKVIQITHDYQVPPDAKAGNKERIYSERSWTRADGTHGSKKCEHSVIGVLVVGAGRGQAFAVCTDKQTCTVHWGKEINERKKREQRKASPSKGNGNTEQARWQREQENWKQERALRDIERGRYGKALPAIIQAVVARVKTAPTKANGLLGTIILDAIDDFSKFRKEAEKLIPRGTSADDLIRHAALFILLALANDYDAAEEFPKQAKAFGIDVKKILDEAAPAPKPAAALKTCTVCDAKHIDPTKHVCSPAALKKAKKKPTAKPARMVKASKKR